MKLKLSLLFFALGITASAQTIGRCPVGADPVNKTRQPTADEEVISNPADQVIKYESGKGKEVTCNLQAGVPVVIDKVTGVAKWVYGCGNKILSPWTPKRTPAPPPPTPTPVATPVILEVTGIPRDITVHVDGEIRHIHTGEVGIIHSGAVALLTPLPPQSSSSGWASRHKKLLVFTAILAGGVAVGAYYATHRDRGHAGPQVTTLPVTGGGLPIVTTLPATGVPPIVTTLPATGGGLPIVTTLPATGGGLPIVTPLPPH